MKFILKSKRLTLRPPKLSDAPILEKYINDRLVSRWTFIPSPYPRGGYKKWIKKSLEKRKKKQCFDFVIYFKNKPIGSIGLNQIDYKNKKGGVGYWLARQYWGRGIMTEALKMILEFGFHQLKLHRIYSSYLQENKASQRVQEKCGLKLEGIFRRDILKGRKYHNRVFRAILLSEYKQKKKWSAKK